MLAAQSAESARAGSPEGLLGFTSHWTSNPIAPGGGPADDGRATPLGLASRGGAASEEEAHPQVDVKILDDALSLPSTRSVSRGSSAGSVGSAGSVDSAGPAGSEQQRDAEAPPDSDIPSGVAEYVDWALARAGGWGRFQKWYCLFLSLPHALCGAQTLAHIFVTTPPIRRRVCSASRAGHCHELLAAGDCGMPASDWETEAPETSVAAEFGLVCESSAAVPLLGTLFFFGFLIGVSYFGGLADRRGRRVSYLGSLLTLQSGALLAAFAPSYTAYALARLLVGAGVGGLGLVTYAWNAEVLGSSTRAVLMIVMGWAWATGIVLLSPLSYVLPEWRWLSFVLFLAGLPFLPLLHCLRESPVWLAGPGQRPEEAHAVLCHIAAVNGRPPVPKLPSVESKPSPQPNSEVALGKQRDLAKKAEPGLLELLSDPRLATRFRVMCLAWFAISTGYYGLSMNVANLGGSVYISSALSAAVELPVHPLGFFLSQTRVAGRRGTIMSALIVGGLCCMFSAFAGRGEDGPGALMLTSVYVGKAAISMSFGLVYLYATELFPTDVRTGSMGLQSLCARIGGMLAPMVADLGKASQVLPLLIFGAPCLVAGLSFLALPETLGTQLPCSISDIPEPAKKSWNPCARSFAELQEDPGAVGQSVAEKPTVIGSSA